MKRFSILDLTLSVATLASSVAAAFVVGYLLGWIR